MLTSKIIINSQTILSADIGSTQLYFKNIVLPYSSEYLSSCIFVYSYSISLAISELSIINELVGLPLKSKANLRATTPASQVDLSIEIGDNSYISSNYDYAIWVSFDVYWRVSNCQICQELFGSSEGLLLFLMDIESLKGEWFRDHNNYFLLVKVILEANLFELEKCSLVGNCYLLSIWSFCLKIADR